MYVLCEPSGHPSYIVEYQLIYIYIEGLHLQHPMTFNFSLDTLSPVRRPQREQDEKEHKASDASYILDLVSNPDYVLLPPSRISPTNASSALPSKIPVDIILDAYLLNVIPRSLLPTIAYMLLIVIPVAWYVSGFVESIFATFMLCQGPESQNDNHEFEMKKKR